MYNKKKQNRIMDFSIKVNLCLNNCNSRAHTQQYNGKKLTMLQDNQPAKTLLMDWSY